MSNPLLIAVPPSEILASDFTLASGATVTNAGGLTSIEPSDFAELSTLDPLKCYVSVLADSSNRANGLAQGACNIQLPSPNAAGRKMKRQAYYRTVLSSDATVNSRLSTVLPNGVTGGTPTGGAATTTLDDDPYVGGSTAYYQVNVGSAMVVDFATGGALQSGNYQVFCLQVKSAVAKGSCQFDVDLYESGSKVKTIRSVYLAPSVGMVTLIAVWNTDDVSALANVQLGIDHSAGYSANLQVHRVRWLSAAGSDILDTGFVPLGYSDSLPVSAGSLAVPPLSHLTLAPEPSGTFPVHVIHNWICDALTDMSTAYSANDVLQVGRIWGSAHVLTQVGPQAGFVGVDDSTERRVTVGGQDVGRVGVRRRLGRFTLDYLSPAEAATLFGRLDYASGLSGPFMISFGHDDETMRPWGTLYCTLDQTDGITYRSTPDYRSRPLTVREKL